MTNYGTILSECLQSPFNIDRYRNFVVNFLKGTQLKAVTSLRSAELFAEYSYYVKGYALVGEYTDPNRKRVGIYVVKLNTGRDIEKARSKQRNFIAKLLADNNFDAAIAAFYLNEESKWRLSFVRLDYEFAKGKISKNLTPAKRYSYLVGQDEPCHTALESLLPIFEDENFMPSIDNIEQAFSIEKVTKQFFEKYKEKYLELKEYLEQTPCFVEESEQRGFTSEQFAKKLMGQIVFLYFLQKKGWLGVKAINKEITEKEYKNLYYFNSVTRKFADKIYTKIADNVYKLNQAGLGALSESEEEYVARAIKGSPWGDGPRTFVRDLFEFAKSKNGNFFDDYLEPLFYKGLNKKREADNYYAPLHCRIPFLNGGLFEPLDNYDWENNFFSIPNEMFSNADTKGLRDADGILDIFDRYNFTMNEDEPLEKEVAVDPEMLGKIFENLLDISDRKSKGAFYTPREIVHYMCQESLTNYIVNTVGTPYEDTKDFVVYGEIMKDEDCSRESTYGMSTMLMADSIYNNLTAIDNALADVRVADPAVGSGAFPMGMLSEIVKLREIITEYMARDLCLQPQYKGAEKAAALRSAIWKLRNEKRNSYNLKKETMRNSIYAVDIEPSAVDIAKLRLWLTLVVEQEIDPNDPYNNKPVALPNLDCNIMCGNSLIDEFEGIDLSFDDVIGNNIVQISMFGKDVEDDFEKMFKLQRDYFYADNHDDKHDLKQKIDTLKERILSIVFASASEETKKRFEVANSKHSTPFFLWKLNFAKVFKEKGGFDIVIGNPPYLDSENMTNAGLTYERNFISRKYTFAKGNWDIYIAFFELGYKKLSSNGCEIYITPDKWISKPFGEAMRVNVIKNIKSILIAGRDVFETALVDSIITLIDAREHDNIDIYRMENKKIIHSNNVSKSILSYPYALDILSSKSIGLIVKLEENSKPLSSVGICENACATSDCYKLKEYIFSLESESDFNEKYLKIINTGTIGRFVSRWGNTDMKYLKDKYKFPVVDKEEFLLAFTNTYGRKSIKPKIIIKGLTLLDACIDEDGIIIPGKSTMMIHTQIDDLYLLMGIINSKLMMFYIGQKYSSSSYNGGINFTKDMINYLPIKNEYSEYYDEIRSLTREIVLRKKQDYNFNSASLETQINLLMYKIYSLTDEEIAIVEKSIK